METESCHDFASSFSHGTPPGRVPVETVTANAEPPATAHGAVPGAQPTGQWLQVPLSLRVDLNFDLRTQDGREVFVVEDPARGTFFQLGRPEFEFASRLDGVRTGADIVDDLNATTIAEVTPQSAEQICAWLVQNNLAFVPSASSSDRVDRQARRASQQQFLAWINPISVRVRLFDPTWVLNQSGLAAGSLFGVWFFGAWLIAGAVATYMLLAQWEALGSASAGVLAPGRWFCLLLVWLCLKSVHEWAHGVACRRFGGEVPEAGVLFLLFAPMPYVDVTSSWAFRSRWQRFVVAAAGMYVELFVAFLAAIVWGSVDAPFVRMVSYNVMLLASVSTVLFNANPLMRFDGYFMLTDAVDVPNLYQKGLRWFGDRLKWLLFGTPRAGGIAPSTQMPLVRVYGLLAFCWKVLICLSLTLAASSLFHGAGLVLAVVAGGLWIAMPVWKFFRTALKNEAKNIVPWRTAVSAAVLLLATGAVFVLLKSPATGSAPAIVQFETVQILRAESNGFLGSIRVTEGETVCKGELLAMLTNEELEVEVANLQRQIDEAEIQFRIYQQEKRLGEAEQELREIESLRKQFREKSQQAKGLEIRSPIDGVVVARDLNSRVGQYLTVGQEVLTIARPDCRKVVVSIDQQDARALGLDDVSDMKVVMPGQPAIRAVVARVDERASDLTTHTAWYASHGGPLAVEPQPDGPEMGEPGYRLISPRFEVELTLPQNVGGMLRCGQVGRAMFRTSQTSLGAWLTQKTRQWLSTKLEPAN